ncbi:hypothetical protein JR316_0002964 [Psilocybe cubensis]|uniref:Uncharacterized protein n=1 Tax=Psilocybe cubensis TaxID=181762 RepID=A0ACB8H6K8_PSICU|nr:hypothetical protein JR316_0002964 [Psilocybe cubensis]KAH9483496.1 hypothetical protein JR316_0002964 [Psilocybe cubensis]
MATTSNIISTKAVAPRGKGKQRKQFLEKNDALALAASIADTQEKISITKAERHHKPRDESLAKQERKHSMSTKAKLKETKAALKAKQVNAKRERAKSRKERLKPKVDVDVGVNKHASGKVRKTVSFA